MCGNENNSKGPYSITFAAGNQDYTERSARKAAYEPHRHTQAVYGSSIEC